MDFFFASDTFAKAYVFLTGLVARRPHLDKASTIVLGKDELVGAAIGLGIMLLLVDVPQFVKKDQHAMLRWNLAARSAAFLLLVLATILFRGTEHVPFLYFKF